MGSTLEDGRSPDRPYCGSLTILGLKLGLNTPILLQIEKPIQTKTSDIFTNHLI